MWSYVKISQISHKKYLSQSPLNAKKGNDDFFFKTLLQYFSISSKTTLDRDLRSFASGRWRSELVLPPFFVCVRQPEVTGKPEVNSKTVRTARWCDIFIFPNMPYPVVKPWHYTWNDEFIRILKSDLDKHQKKNEKIDIFFHSLWFLTLKCNFFFGHFRLPETNEIERKH